MNMFMPNDVYSLESQRIRVLWSNMQIVFWIDIDDDKALTKLAPKSELEHLMAKGSLKVIDDPHISLALNSPLPGSLAEQVQDKAWNAIKGIVIREPDIYHRKTRGPLFNKVLEASGATKQTLYRWLRRYWQFGLCRNALSGRFDNCGGAGKTKAAGDKKRGAPRTRSPGTGINVDEQIRLIFRVAIEKCLLHEGKYEFDYAYNQVLIAYGVPKPCKPEDILEVPTERQFRYFYEKEYSPIEITRKREGEINYLKDFRPVLGTSTAEVAGPGSRYQIDATIADVYLVSERDREEIVGRPTVYFVVDVFSRAIVGLYVGLENPSWVSAMEALINAACDKVAYCKSFGIDITDDLWPTVGLSEALIGDRGEMLGRHVEVMSKAFNINIENTPPYRADWKGIVERFFRTSQTKMKPFVEGYVTKNPIGKKRHGKDYRQDGIHTLKEFIQMIIRIVLFYNNEHIVSTYDPDQDVPPTLPHNPLTLWNWGIEYRTGRLRRPAEDLVRVNLFPHSKATITEHGLRLFGCYFSCKAAIGWGWFEGNYKGSKIVTVAYDFYSVNTIYIRPNDTFSDYIEAELTERSREYRDLTIWEVWNRNDVKADTTAISKLKKRAGSVNLVNELEAIAKQSRDHQPAVKKKTKLERVRGIKDNKKAERQYERTKKARNGETTKTGIHDNVIPIRKEESRRVSFKLPTRLKDLLKEDPQDE